MNPENTLDDPIKVARLVSQLEIANLQLRQTERYTNLLANQNRVLLGLQERQVDHASWLAKTLYVSVSESFPLIARIQELALFAGNNSKTQVSLNRLEDFLESGILEEDRERVVPVLKTIEESSPGALMEVYNVAKTIGTGTSSTLLAKWIGSLLGLP